MSHRVLRSAATVLLASVPLIAAAPAQAAPQSAFPCAVGVQKVDISATSTVSVSITCAVARTVGVSLTANGVQFASLQQTVQAGVQQSVSVTLPKVAHVCATLQTDGQSTAICTP